MVRLFLILSALILSVNPASAQSGGSDFSSSLDIIGEPINLLSQVKADVAYVQYSPDISEQASPGQVAAELGYSARAHIKAPSNARLQILVDKATRSAKNPNGQTMHVYIDGYMAYVFDVSTGREKWELAKSGRRYFSRTPTGTYGIYVRRVKHWSNTWKAWMPYSQFIVGGIAIHATTPDHYRELGSRASGGCIRLKNGDAKALWDFVNEVGVDNTAVTVFDSSQGQTNWIDQMAAESIKEDPNDPMNRFRGIY